MPFEVGEIVQLRSSSPKMTVVSVPDPFQVSLAKSSGQPTQEMYKTTWFAGLKNEKGEFPEEALVAAMDEAKTNDKGR